MYFIYIGRAFNVSLRVHGFPTIKIIIVILLSPFEICTASSDNIYIHTRETFILIENYDDDDNVPVYYIYFVYTI